MEVLIKNKAVETILEEIFEAFAAIDPQGAEDFIQHVKEESQQLVKPSGMSTDGAILNLMKIPCIRNSLGEKINLYSFIKQTMHSRCGIDDFFRDAENYRLMCKVWTNAKVKRKPTPFLRMKDYEDPK